MPGRGSEHHVQVQQLDAAGRRQDPRAVRAPRRVGDVPRPAAPDHGGGERQAHLLEGIVGGDGRGHGAELGVGFDPETLGGAGKAHRGEQPCCWRPQRGLPERSVAVLKAWMFEHFLKP
jgi:hypothetical protein